MACVFFLPLLVQDVLDLVDQSWLSIIGTSVAVVARDTLLPRLVLGDGVVFGCAFSAGKCGVTTRTVGIGLESTVRVVVCSFAYSGWVGSEVFVGGTELRSEISPSAIGELRGSWR